MQTIIAKWIFTAAATLSPGTDQSWPQMAAVRSEGVLESVITTVMAPPPEGCQAPLPGCPAPVPVPRIREFCIPAGAYQVTARIGLQPLAAGQSAEGRLWIRETGGTGASDLLVATFFGAPGSWTVDGATGVLLSGGTCYSWRHDLTGAVTVNPDPRVTYLAIVRVAE